MKRLKNRRRRVDALRSESRPRKRGRIGRNVYLTLLALLILLLFDELAGDLVYLRGEGMVSQDVSIVAPEFSGSVLSVHVEAGDKVLRGQALTTMRSQQMLRDIAEMSTDLASAEARLSEMRIQQRKLASLIPVARDRVEATEHYRKDVSGLRHAGLASMSEHASAIEDAFDALADLKEFEAEATLADAEISHVGTAAERARHALSKVENLYNDGVLVAPTQGIAGIVSITQGEGVEEGERVIEIFHGELYVLAYFPVGALYRIEPGDEIVLRYGLQTVPGRIDSRVPLAYRLPQEFQRAFQTIERQQLVRIRIDGEASPPLFTKVVVTRPWSVRAVFADAATSVGTVIRAAHSAVAGGSDLSAASTGGVICVITEINLVAPCISASRLASKFGENLRADETEPPLPKGKPSLAAR